LNLAAIAMKEFALDSRAELTAGYTVTTVTNCKLVLKGKKCALFSGKIIFSFERDAPTKYRL
jgi:hypothetical protein